MNMSFSAFFDNQDDPGADPRADAEREAERPPVRRGQRTRKVAEQDRQELKAATEREVDEIVTQYHALLPREKAGKTAAIYARYSTEFQQSIGAQVRAVLDWALKHEVFVPREFVFFDMGIRGHTRQRPGLDCLQKVLERREVDILLVLATHRLFRKMSSALGFVEEHVVERNLRAVFVASGIDTADGEVWQPTLALRSWMDERATKVYGANISAAHLESYMKGRVVTIIPYGYRGEEITGQINRRNRPVCLLKPDPAESIWVKRIFRWFVTDRVGVAEITWRLNQAVDESGSTAPWSFKTVYNTLKNPIYRGWWIFGKKIDQWDPHRKQMKRVKREEPLRQEQREELRIVDDETWNFAQLRMAEKSRLFERKPYGDRRASRWAMLNGLFFCPAHDRPLIAFNNTILSCYDCQFMPPDRRPLYSGLNRKVALEVLCQALAERIGRDDRMVESVLAACQQAAGRMQRPNPGHTPKLRARLDELERQIDFIYSNAGKTDRDRAKDTAWLNRLRKERNEAKDLLVALELDRIRPVRVPDEAEVRGLLGKLAAILATAITERSEEGIARVRDVLCRLTGGRIDLVQCGHRSPHAGWLQGRFHPLSGLVAPYAGRVPVLDPAEKVVLDFRKVPPYQALAERIKALVDEGQPYSAIIRLTGVKSGTVDKALRYWHMQHGQIRIDGGFRRKEGLLDKVTPVANPSLPPPMSKQNSPQNERFLGRTRDRYARIKALHEEGHSVLEIARKLGITERTIYRALATDRERRGIIPIDTRPQHIKNRSERAKALTDQGHTIKEIAKILEVSVSTVQKDLRAWLGRHSSGLELPDPSSGIQATGSENGYIDLA